MFSGYEIPSFIYDIRGYFILRLSYKNTLSYQIKFFKKHIAESNHLEACIGNGTFAKFYLPRFLTFTALDASPKSIDAAKKKFPNASLMTAYIENMPTSHKFDSINLPNSFHTISLIEAGVEKLAKCLSDDGIFSFNVLLTPKNKISKMVNNYGIRTGILHRPYLVEEVDSILEKNKLSIIEKIIKNNCAYYRVKTTKL